MATGVSLSVLWYLVTGVVFDLSTDFFLGGVTFVMISCEQVSADWDISVVISGPSISILINVLSFTFIIKFSREIAFKILHNFS